MPSSPWLLSPQVQTVPSRLITMSDRAWSVYPAVTAVTPPRPLTGTKSPGCVAFVPVQVHTVPSVVTARLLYPHSSPDAMATTPLRLVTGVGVTRSLGAAWPQIQISGAALLGV